MIINKHQQIPKHVFITLLSKFTALDNVISLHYTTHTAHPRLTKILSQASSLAKCAIVMADIEQITEVWRGAYVVFRQDDEVCIKFGDVDVSLMRRKETFIEFLNSWIDANQSIPEIPRHAITITSVQKSPSKVTKPRSASTSPTKKSKFQDLKNDPSKFKFTEKSEPSRAAAALGMSLLERIRLKEKRAREDVASGPTPREKYERYLAGKIPMIYDAIYQVYNSEGDGERKGSRSFSTSKLIQIIQDSAEYPVVAEEIHDGMKLIVNKLSKIQMIEKNGVKVLRVAYLDRDQDLMVLKV
ncbi:Cell division cycle protein CDT1 [Candida viswanathii]|uniref:Cell division cycle protein CDT1 n=1 Tax=Candida viswanathii TaxID=5486 RepID=A0A367XN72_9ASCO|nr:Cell division cycle protein CDT1 [Candida viswanathii]